MIIKKKCILSLPLSNQNFSTSHVQSQTAIQPSNHSLCCHLSFQYQVCHQTDAAVCSHIFATLQHFMLIFVALSQFLLHVFFFVSHGNIVNGFQVAGAMSQTHQQLPENPARINASQPVSPCLMCWTQRKANKTTRNLTTTAIGNPKFTKIFI